MVKPRQLAPGIKPAIRAILAKLEPPPPAGPLACAGCGGLPERAHAVLYAGEALPAAALALEDVLLYGDPGASRLLRCRRCGGLFLHELSHDFDIAESRDEVTLSRCTEQAAIDYLDTHLPSFTFLGVIQQGTTWVVSYQHATSTD